MSRLLALALTLGLLAGCDAVGPTPAALDGSSAAAEARATPPSTRTKIRVLGRIENLNAEDFCVDGHKFVVDTRILVLDHQNRPVPLSSVTNGVLVEVEGYVHADGTFRATEVKLEDARENVSVSASGRIEELTQGTVIVAGRTYTTTSSTRYLDHGNRPVPRHAFTVGTYVEAEGTPRADGSLVADHLKMDSL